MPSTTAAQTAVTATTFQYNCGAQYTVRQCLLCVLHWGMYVELSLSKLSYLLMYSQCVHFLPFQFCFLLEKQYMITLFILQTNHLSPYTWRLCHVLGLQHLWCELPRLSYLCKIYWWRPLLAAVRTLVFPGKNPTDSDATNSIKARYGS